MIKSLLYKKICFLALVFICFIQISSAITANSSSYSVIMFGTGMAASNPSDGTYNSTALSEAKTTTRNAESTSLTANIGFFENTPYHRTVSIVSYSISPRTAVVGSTISLSISALNYQSVWAKITAPNAQEQILNLINSGSVSYLPSPSIVGMYNVTFYANSSTGAIASAIDYFDFTEQAQTTAPQTGRGDGTAVIIEKCTYIWDCTSWSLCSDGRQKRECKNTGNCTGEEGKPIEERECSDALFDVSIKLDNLYLTENETLAFNVDLIEKLGIEKIDVHIKYSIIDKDDNEIFSQIETKAIRGKLSYQKQMGEIKLKDGEYKLRVEIIYGNLQRAFAEQNFEVAKKKLKIPFKKEIILTIMLALIAVAIAYYLSRKRRKKRHMTEVDRIIRNIKKIEKRDYKEKQYKILNKLRKYLPYVIVLILVATLTFLVYSSKLSATGHAISNISGSGKTLIISIAAIIAILAMLITKKSAWLYKGIIKLTEIITSKNKKYPPNSIKGLIKKRVYSESGEYIGKIKEVILGENKIDSFKIKLDKKHRVKAKGVAVGWKSIKNIKDVVIIDKEILNRFIT